MRDFKDYLAREQWKTELLDWEYQQYKQNRKTREERAQKRRWQLHWIAVTLLWAMVICAVIFFPAPEALAEEEPIPEPVPETRVHLVLPTVEEMPELCVYPEEDIPAAEPESPYLREDIPLDAETQALLYEACGETGIDYELALAVVRKETTYRNVVGDGGESYGYMQVQPRWHKARMERLGVDDLMDPLSNFRVGCDYLAELLNKYTVEEALTAYNTGSPGYNQYAATVIGYWEELSDRVE